MPIKQIPGGVTAAQGFTASGVHCGIRKNKSKRDLALIYADTLCSAAAVYTPVSYTHLDVYKRQAFLQPGFSRNLKGCFKRPD